MSSAAPRALVQRCRRVRVAAGVMLVQLAVACRRGAPGIDGTHLSNSRDTVGLPLTELGNRTYLGFAGGLYDDGNNTPPEAHASVGAARARDIQPLDANGIASASGTIVLLSIGMSNASQEFCGGGVTTNCDAGTFMQRTAAASDVNYSTLVVVNGAQGGMDAGE